MSASTPTLRRMAQSGTTGGARYTERYTAAQKDAILHAALVDGRRGTEIIALAKTGQLGIPAFEIDRYVYQVIARGREGFENTNDTALANASNHELRALEIAAVAHSRATRAMARKTGMADPKALREAARTLSDIRRDRAATSPKPQRRGTEPKPATSDRSNEPEPANTDVLATLLDQAPSRNGKAGRGPVAPAAP